MELYLSIHCFSGKLLHDENLNQESEEDSMWDYTSKVMDHFLNPRNVGEIENPDAVAEV